VARLTGEVRDPERPGVSAPAREVLAAVAARPWRRTALDDASQRDALMKIERAQAQGSPLEFSLPFGGYKGPRTPSAPHLDWAEVFWLDYLRRYAAGIAALHPPGVVISLSCMTGVLPWINRLPEESQQLYLSGLRALLLRRSSPRIRFDLVDHTAEYGGAGAVLALLEERVAQMPEPGPAERASALRNLLPADGGADDAGIGEAEIVRAARRCAAMMSLELRRQFNKYGPRIQITHQRGGSLALHLGSCRTSSAQPWVAHGFLDWRADRREWFERLSTRDHPQAASLAIRVEHPLAALSPALRYLPLQPEPRQPPGEEVP
jgi:hypothetical protein